MSHSLYEMYIYTIIIGEGKKIKAYCNNVSLVLYIFCIDCGKLFQWANIFLGKIYHFTEWSLVMKFGGDFKWGKT